jgi:hypothetical protein
MDLPFQNKEPKQELTPLEKRKQAVEQQQAQIDKEYGRKIFVEKYAKSLGLAAFLVVLFFFGVYGVVTNFQFFRDVFSTQPAPPPVIVDGPGEDFAITAQNPVIIENPDEASYDIFARMVNVDTEWGVSELDYTIELLSASGDVVGTRVGQTYILPQTRKALAEINIPASVKPVSLRIDFNPVKVQKLQDFGTIDFAVTGTRYFEFNNGGRVSGTFINNSPFGFDTIDVVVVLFDRNQNVVGVNRTVIGQVLSSQQRDFTLTWPEYQGEGIQVVVEPSVDVFSSSNFLNTFSQTQELDF